MPNSAPTTPPDRPVSAVPLVVLKLDDLFATEGRVPERWKRVIDFSARRQLKLSIGVICNSLEGDQPEYFADLKALSTTGLVELWHHGYDHRRWEDDGVTFHEFAETDRAHQRDHLVRSQQLAKDKLGLTFTTFGAPFNATDATTADVLAVDMPDINVWLYGDTQRPAGKFICVRVAPLDLEVPVHKPNYASLVKGFEAERTRAHPYYVLQGHPMSWDDAAFAEFVRIVDYLGAQGCEFVLPAELPARGRVYRP